MTPPLPADEGRTDRRYVIVDRFGVESVAHIGRHKAHAIAHAKSCNVFYPREAPHTVIYRTERTVYVTPTEFPYAR